MKRALIILVALLILMAIGVLIYFYFFASKASIAVAPTGSSGLPIAGNNSTAGGKNNSSKTQGNTPVSVAPRLVEINAGPITPGEVVVDVPAKNASSSPDVLATYIERESGNVFSYSVQTNKNTRTSNKTIPGIQVADWLPNASAAFVRYLSGDDFSTINTYALNADGSDGLFLPQDLADIAVSSTSVLTLASGVNGSVASLENTDGTGASTIFTTPLSELRVSFAGKNKYLAYTKPSAGLAGDAFIVDASGHFSRIAGPLDGLTALASHSGTWVLISYVLNNALQMELINTATNETVPLPVATITDKCVWTNDDSAIYCGIPTNTSSDDAYPDDWYQGAVQFSDKIWKIDVSGRFAQLTLDFGGATNGTLLDAEALAIDPSNTELVFINKNDNSLWGYQL
jgi:hypothetical protein